MSYTSRSTLGTPKEDDDANSSGYSSGTMIDADSYAKDAPTLLQLDGIPYHDAQSTLGPSTDPTDKPQWIRDIMRYNSHTEEYRGDTPVGYHEDDLNDVQLSGQPYHDAQSTLGPSNDPTDDPDWIKEVVSKHSHE